MPATTMTLALDGEVPLDLFARAVESWHDLVSALTEEVDHAGIRWIVDELESGSAIATIRGEATDLAAVERVVVAYDAVGEALERGADVPGSARARKAARGITAVLNGKITSIRFETPNRESFISSTVGKPPRAVLLRSKGAIEGRVQTLSSRHALRFTLYDSVYDHAVTCYLQEGREEIMRDTWNRRAIVEGMVSRDPVTGRPVSVRQVENVTPIAEVEPGGFRRARGALKTRPDDPLPEEMIRRLRDA